MRFITPLLLALIVAVSSVQAAEPAAQWECLDTSGHKVVQDHPCADGHIAFTTDTVPVYVWAIVAVLGLVWLSVLLPRGLFRLRTPATALPELLPVGVPPLVEQGPPAPRVARPAPTPAAPVVPADWSVEAMARLSPRRFEEMIQALWQLNGYKAVLTGSDLKIHNATTGRLFAVALCEAPNRAVGAAPVHGLWAAVEQHAAGLGVCYGLAGFAADALMFSQGKRLKLVGGAELLAQIRTLKPEQQKSLLAHSWRA